VSLNKSASVENDTRRFRGSEDPSERERLSDGSFPATVEHIKDRSIYKTSVLKLEHMFDKKSTEKVAGIFFRRTP